MQGMPQVISTQDLGGYLLECLLGAYLLDPTGFIKTCPVNDAGDAAHLPLHLLYKRIYGLRVNNITGIIAESDPLLLEAHEIAS